MFLASLFIIAKRWKKLKGPLTGDWIKKILYRHTMGYYAALKKKGILSHATTWKKL